jgi:hypothetical protein
MCQDKSFPTYGNLERIIDWERSGRKMISRFWRKKGWLVGAPPCALCGPARRMVLWGGREKLPLPDYLIFYLIGRMLNPNPELS